MHVDNELLSALYIWVGGGGEGSSKLPQWRCSRPDNTCDLKCNSPACMCLYVSLWAHKTHRDNTTTCVFRSSVLPVCP